jgi:hypothetical protein
MLIDFCWDLLTPETCNSLDHDGRTVVIRTPQNGCKNDAVSPTSQSGLNFRDRLPDFLARRLTFLYCESPLLIDRVEDNDHVRQRHGTGTRSDGCDVI